MGSDCIRTEAPIFYFDACSIRDPVSAPDQVRGHASLDNALAERETPLWPPTQGLKLGNDMPMLVLGIETPCDETAASVVERQSDGSGRILSNVIRSQTAEHAAFG